jgi:hypothetical protein
MRLEDKPNNGVQRMALTRHALTPGVGLQERGM